MSKTIILICVLFAAVVVAQTDSTHVWLDGSTNSAINTNVYESLYGTNVYELTATQRPFSWLEVSTTASDIAVHDSNGNAVASMAGISANTPTNSWYPNWTRPKSIDDVVIYVYTADGKKWKANGWQTLD